MSVFQTAQPKGALAKRWGETLVRRFRRHEHAAQGAQ